MQYANNNRNANRKLIADGLYHKDVYMPFELNLAGTVKPYYSFHARQAARTDRYGEIILRDTIDLALLSIVEVQIVEGRAIKFVGRMKYGANLDLVIVMSSNGVVRTVWLNSSTDKHRTLDRSKYIQAATDGNSRINTAV